VQKWAYLSITLNQNGLVEQGPRLGARLEDAASDLGAQGWELVLCFPLPNARFQILFKRPI
jgi:ABC-type sulfate transport system permease subunit